MARVVRRSGSQNWYAWIWDPQAGEKKLVSTRCSDRRAAEAEAGRLERAAVDPTGHAATRATFGDTLQRFLAGKVSRARAAELSAATVQFYTAKSGMLLAGIARVLGRSQDAPIYLSEITAAVVDDYATLRRDLGASRTTIAHELTTWRGAMRLAIRRGTWRGDIGIFPPAPRNGPRGRWVTFPEVLALFHACVRPMTYRTRVEWPPETEALFRSMVVRGESKEIISETLLAMGVKGASVASVGRRRRELRDGRVEREAPLVGAATFARVAFAIATSAEMAAIPRARRDDVAPDLSSCRVRGSKNLLRDRVVPLALLAFRYLLAYALEHGDGTDGRLFGRSTGFATRLREACRRAGIPHVRPTDLRRTHAKWLRLAGVAPGNIAPSMGHRDSRMVERVYGAASAEELAEVQAAEILAGAGSAARYLFGSPALSGPSGVSPGSNERGKTLEKPVPRDGIEPPTRGFSIPCSTN